MVGIEDVASLRTRLWDAGFRPVPVYNPDVPGPSPGKRPWGDEWQISARLDPPRAAIERPRPDALNTGILCDGLRAIDFDIDNPTLAQRCRALAVEMFGEAPIRMRRGSPRCLVLYRAVEGTPRKTSITGTFGKIEVLGQGNQFVAFGRHHEGADLEWFPEAPGQELRDSLPAISEADVAAFLSACAPIIAAAAPAKANGHDHAPGEPQADPLRVAAALAAIPNSGPADWEEWNQVGMAVWRATGASSAGWEIFNAWSARNASYDPAEARARWDHYFTSPPNQIGAGTIFHMARQQQAEASKQDHPETESTPPPRQDSSRPALSLLWFADIEPVLDARDFVQGLLMEQSSIVVYGQSNSGKTFWTTDLALHVAAGHEWNGRRVEQGGVIYCALEGGIGFKNRVAAWKEDRGISDYTLPFAAITVSLNLLDPDANTSDLIKAVALAAKKMSVPVKLIIIDTLARALAGGNENAPDDMGALVMNMDRVRAETLASVAFVHHSGKDQAKGARGHSSLQAAIDTEIEVIDDEVTGSRWATVVKQRELRKGDAFPFTLRVVELGQNRHGEAVTTCVVEASSADGKPAPRASAALSGHAKRALEVLTNKIAQAGQDGFAGVPDGYASVPEAWWREAFYDRAMPGADDDTKRKAFRRTADSLINGKMVGMANKRVWLCNRNQGH